AAKARSLPSATSDSVALDPPTARGPRCLSRRLHRAAKMTSIAAADLTATAATHKESTMLHYAVVFFVIALIAALFGFGGIAAGAVEIAKVLFFIFLVLFIVSLVLGLFRRDT